MATKEVQCVVCLEKETIIDIDDPENFDEICYTTVGMLLYEGQVVHSIHLGSIKKTKTYAVRIRELEEKVEALENQIGPSP